MRTTFLAAVLSVVALSSAACDSGADVPDAPAVSTTVDGSGGASGSVGLVGRVDRSREVAERLEDRNVSLTP